MRIAVIHHTGVLDNDYGFYISDLLSEYAEWLGYDVQLLNDFLSLNKSSLPENAVIGIDIKAKSGFGLRWWYNTKLPSILKKIKADVVINLNGICSTSVTLPQILAIPDITFLEDATKAKAAWQKLVIKNIKAYCSTASSVFTYSTHAAGVIEKITTGRKGSIHVVPYTAGKQYVEWGWHDKTLTKAEFADNKEFFICRQDDKNEESWFTILRAFSKFKKWQQSSMKLFLIPKHGIVPLNVADRLTSYKYRDDVRLLDDVSEKDESSLTGSAYALIHLPGNDADLLPIAEALQCGLPFITAPTGSLKEYAADTGLYIPGTGHEELGDAIIDVYKNEDKRTQVIESIRTKAIEFNRDAVARSLWEITENAVKAGPPA